MRACLRGLWHWLARVLTACVIASLILVGALRWIDPPLSSFMARQALAGWWNGHPPPQYYHSWVPWERIPAALPLAVIAGEDQRFAEHHGFDPVELRKALATWRAGRGLRGASTITQQTAKNLFLWPARSWVRKGLEAWFAGLIEFLWPKERILEVYLNIAQFSPSTYGVGAASERYFQRPVETLGAREAALLAAVLPAPGAYRLDRPSARLARRADWIAGQVLRLGGRRYLERLKAPGINPAPGRASRLTVKVAPGARSDSPSPILGEGWGGGTAMASAPFIVRGGALAMAVSRAASARPRRGGKNAVESAPTALSRWRRTQLPYEETAVSAEPPTETQPAIVQAVLRAPVAEQQLLLAWSREFGGIRHGGLVGRAKAQAILALTREHKAAWPLAKVVGRAFWIILWEARSWTLRLGVLALIATFLTVGNAAAGIVALGGGIGLPLWVLTGGGGALAGQLADQVVKRRRHSAADPG